MEKSQIVDEGVRFALNNIDKALSATTSKPSYNYLYRVLKREKYQLKDITKTGDLVRYFEGFADGKHYHAKDFLELAAETDFSFIPSEFMADELKKRFPDEINHITNIYNFEVGQSYSNGFLSIVLGGSYALSFRLSRNPNYAYIMMNSYGFNLKRNIWRDNYNSLIFTPPGRFYDGIEGARKLIDKHGDKTILVFDKINSDGFTFFGFYHFKGIADNGVELVRDNRDDSEVFFKKIIEDDLEFNNLINNNLIPQLVIVDILIQKAIENGIDFNISRIGEDDFSISFPYGFYDFMETFDEFELIVTATNNVKTKPKKMRRYFLNVKSYKSTINSLGWEKLEDEIKSYNQVYYKLLLEGSENTNWFNAGPSIESIRKNINDSYIYNFIISAISTDVESQLSDDSYIKYNQAVKNKILDKKSDKIINFDLSIEGYYSRIGVDSPIFQIVSSFSYKTVESYFDYLSLDNISHLVFIALNREKTNYVNIQGRSFLVLGACFVSQLAKLYPSIYAQFIIPEDRTDLEEKNSNKKAIPNTPVMKAGKNYSDALELNISYFQNLVKDDKPISIITGNGVSIPFGSETWNELSNNLLNQLRPRFIESCDQVQNFFGNLSFFTTDFSYDTLCMKLEEPLFWRTLNYSIYRRFSESMYLEETAIKSISTIKMTFGDRITLFTYNYDTFLEGQYGHDYAPKSLLPVLEPGVVENEVIHLHGIFKQTDSEGDNIILTRSKYYEIYNDHKKNKAMNLFIDSLKNNVCLFIGSSMTDMFQMMIIDKACKSCGGKTTIYALLPIDSLQEGAKETIYQYFLKKSIFVIPFKKFEDLPETILKLFSLK